MKSVQFHASPVLAIRLPAWRSRAVVFILFLAFVSLIARAIYLQVFTTEFLQTEGERRYTHKLEMPATRGKIMDRNGVILASSVPAAAIWANPRELDASPQQLSELAKLLGMPVAEVKKKLARKDTGFVYLKRQVPQAIATKIQKLSIAGIDQRKEYIRTYPEGEAMAHVVGFTNVEDIGQEGIELGRQKELTGQTGSRRVIRDRLGRVIEDVADISPPHDGKDISLSIDGKIQYLAYSQLKAALDKHKAKAGAIIVLDVQTGEILALANLPTYNPNDRRNLTGAQLRNRVLTDTYEPGSTLKPFTVALALEEGVVKPDTVIQTAPGKLSIGNATISDSHPHGALSVADIIKVSSNVGTTKIAMQMEARQMWDMFSSVGLGQAPKLGFPGAVAGRLRPYKNWRPIEQATMSYGYGLSVSLIQIARAYTLFARNGDMIPLTLFKTNGAPAFGARVISPETAAQMRTMLEAATGPEGTAPQAQVMGYRVAGKTGTARKLVGGAYTENKYVGSFVGFAPASNPRIVVAVMIDEPTTGGYYGGVVAGPVFSSVVAGAMRLMNVEPDAPIQSLIVPAEPVQESF